MSTLMSLPDVRLVGRDAPGRWLAAGWRDLMQCFWPAMIYGASLAVFSAWLSWQIMNTNGAYWAVAIAAGFVFVAPMIAMGLYAAGRAIDAGRKPKLAEMLVVRSALRPDLGYLGLALLFVFMIWSEIARIVYGLSTQRIYDSFTELAAFALATPAGWSMLFWGSLIGCAIGFATFTFVVVAAPMLLDRRADFFIAVVTSVRAVVRNLAVMAGWAVILAVLVLLSAATGFVALTVVFPWLGLASWRAYRDLVADTTHLEFVGPGATS